ncbi:hypothetical protein ACFPMF_06805 [Larkinella bovis]|uniref:Uncharacterized protein n=1 Tax=Larkinella bovis TaxID=683041 RepID=A0ABW0I8Z3_9BACT
MNPATLEEELHDFRKTFIDFGVIRDQHFVHWNETFATDNKERLIRVVGAVVRYALDNQLPIPFDRLILFFHKGEFDLYFRTVKAYSVWFFDTLEKLLMSPVSLSKPLKL